MPYTIPTDLDALAGEIADATGYSVVSDPGALTAPCVYLALPTSIEQGTLTGLEATVPVWVLTDKPGKAGRDVLLTMLPRVLAVPKVGVAARPEVLTVGKQDWRGYVIESPVIFTETP